MPRLPSTIRRRTRGHDVRFGVIPYWGLRQGSTESATLGITPAGPTQGLLWVWRTNGLGRAGSGLRNVTIPPSGSFPQANIDSKNLMGNWCVIIPAGWDDDL